MNPLRLWYQYYIIMIMNTCPLPQTITGTYYWCFSSMLIVYNAQGKNRNLPSKQWVLCKGSRLLHIISYHIFCSISYPIISYHIIYHIICQLYITSYWYMTVRHMVVNCFDAKAQLASQCIYFVYMYALHKCIVGAWWSLYSCCLHLQPLHRHRMCCHL